MYKRYQLETEVFKMKVFPTPYQCEWQITRLTQHETNEITKTSKNASPNVRNGNSGGRDGSSVFFFMLCLEDFYISFFLYGCG